MARSIISAERGVNGVARKFYGLYKWKRYEVDVEYELNKQLLGNPTYWASFDWSYISAEVGWIGAAYGPVSSIESGQDVLARCEGFNISSTGKVGVSEPTSFNGLENYIRDGAKCLENNYVGIFANGTAHDVNDRAYVTYSTSFDWGSYYNHLIVIGATWNNSARYVYKINTSPTNVRGTYIDDVESDDENAYPDNGIQDGYWYVKQ